MSYTRDTSEDLVWNSSTNSYEPASSSGTLVLTDGNGNVYVLSGSALVVGAPEPETVTLTIVYQVAGASTEPSSTTVNGTTITTLPSTVTVNSGESCTITVTGTTSSYPVYIFLDGSTTAVVSDAPTVTYTFTPTENHTIGVARSTEKG